MGGESKLNDVSEDFLVNGSELERVRRLLLDSLRLSPVSATSRCLCEDKSVGDAKVLSPDAVAPCWPMLFTWRCVPIPTSSDFGVDTRSGSTTLLKVGGTKVLDPLESSDVGTVAITRTDSSSTSVTSDEARSGHHGPGSPWVGYKFCTRPG
jgi:hypothetical protein